MITDHEADILSHTSQNGRFVTNDPVVIDMGVRGMLRDHGPWELAGGAHFLTMTPRSRELLNEWRSAQPKPTVKKSRISREFKMWGDYCEAFGRTPFSKFWKEIWPIHKHRI